MNYQKIKMEAQYHQLQQNPYLKEKYDNKIGIYSISINNNIVYIGKSTNMLQRLSNHIFFIENLQFTKSNKYKVLADLHKNGYQIDFDIMQLCNEEELGWVEGELIRKHMPILNYQIPKAENYKSYTINKLAAVVDYKAMVQLLDQEQPDPQFFVF